MKHRHTSGGMLAILLIGALLMSGCMTTSPSPATVATTGLVVTAATSPWNNPDARGNVPAGADLVQWSLQRSRSGDRGLRGLWHYLSFRGIVPWRNLLRKRTGALQRHLQQPGRRPDALRRVRECLPERVRMLRCPVPEHEHRVPGGTKTLH